MANSPRVEMARTICTATSNPHSSETVAKTMSESAAKTFCRYPLPGPRPKRPPEAMHIMAWVC